MSLTKEVPMATADLDRFENWRRREPQILRGIPYVLMAIGIFISVFNPPPTTAERVTVGAIAAAALIWEYLWWTSRRAEPCADAGTIVYYFGLVAAAGALIYLQPWFGVFGFVGYLRAGQCLPGRWQYLGFAATASVMGLSQIGGPENFQGAGLAAYGVLWLMNFGLGTGFTYFGQISEEQSEYRRKTIDELSEVNKQLEATLAENAGLHVQLLAQAREAGINDERQRMAREIHDTIAQGLTGVITQLEAADQAPAEARGRHLEMARTLARESLGEARRSVQALRPQQLEGARLPDALAELTKRWSEQSGIAVHLETTGTPVPLLAELEVTLYRVAQEALTNVAKHARATRAVVTLSYIGASVSLDIRDDGRGFDPSTPRPEGFGLTSMRQRVMQSAGRLAIEAAPGQGTAVSAVVPSLAAREDKEA